MLASVRTGLAAALAACLLTAFPLAQGYSPLATPNPRSGIIMGVVVDAATRRGVGKVVVHVKGRGFRDSRLTDAAGRFYFKFLPAGDFSVTAEKPGFVDGAFGKRRPAGEGIVVTLFAGQIVTDVDVELFRPSTISGLVADESGDPLVGINVRAIRREHSGGGWKYSDMRTEITDDRGDFRFFDLVPGEYLVFVPSVQITVPVETFESIGLTGSVTSEIQAVLNANGVPQSSDILPSPTASR